jgi:hypothetical protein
MGLYRSVFVGFLILLVPVVLMCATAFAGRVPTRARRDRERGLALLTTVAGAAEILYAACWLLSQRGPEVIWISQIVMGAGCALFGWATLRRMGTEEYFRQVYRDDPRFCGRCGYNLTGNVTGVCSECGWRLPES